MYVAITINMCILLTTYVCNYLIDTNRSHENKVMQGCDQVAYNA